jgi:hypothetical protein
LNTLSTSTISKNNDAKILPPAIQELRLLKEKYKDIQFVQEYKQFRILKRRIKKAEKDFYNSSNLNNETKIDFRPLFFKIDYLKDLHNDYKIKLIFRLYRANKKSRLVEDNFTFIMRCIDIFIQPKNSKADDFDDDFADDFALICNAFNLAQSVPAKEFKIYFYLCCRMRNKCLNGSSSGEHKLMELEDALESILTVIKRDEIAYGIQDASHLYKFVKLILMNERDYAAILDLHKTLFILGYDSNAEHRKTSARLSYLLCKMNYDPMRLAYINILLECMNDNLSVYFQHKNKEFYLLVEKVFVLPLSILSSTVVKIKNSVGTKLGLLNIKKAIETGLLQIGINYEYKIANSKMNRYFYLLGLEENRHFPAEGRSLFKTCGDDKSQDQLDCKAQSTTTLLSMINLAV